MVLVLWVEKETCGYCEVNHNKRHLRQIVTIIQCGKEGERTTRVESNAMTRSQGKQPDAQVLQRYKRAAAAAAAETNTIYHNESHTVPGITHRLQRVDLLTCDAT